MDQQIVYDLCIVGAGMFGSAAARHASADNAIKVCLVGPSEPTPEERYQRNFFAAHYDEGRITRVLDEVPECQILAKHSIRRHIELEQKSGIPFYNPVGCVLMGRKNSQYISKLKDAGYKERVQLTTFNDENALQKKFPFLRMKDDECALFDNNGAGYINPRKLVAAQKKVALSQGCDIIESEVIEVTSKSIHEVRTVSMGTIKSKKVLIATGAFTGLKTFEALGPFSLKRARRTIALLRVSKQEAEKLCSMPSIIRRLERKSPPAYEIGAYILPPIQYPDGEYYVKFGESGNPNSVEINTLEQMKNWYLSNGDEDLINTHLGFVSEIFPEVNILSAKTASCATCYTPSGLPYIDKVSPTVTIACGGNGKGAKLSDEVGRIAAKLSITGEWDSEIPQELFKVTFR